MLRETKSRDQNYEYPSGRNVIIVGTTLVIVLVMMVMSLNTLETTNDVSVIKPVPENYNPYQKLYDEMLAPTVKISSASGTGSGVIINTPLTPPRLGRDSTVIALNRGDVIILTAAHVVGNNTSVTVTVYSYGSSTACSALDKSSYSISASVVITDTNKDLALLRLKPNIQETGRHALALIFTHIFSLPG
jgi:S1-C subfamily serine protease